MDVMDDELNGHEEFSYNGPNQQNTMWARHLADVLLERPVAPNADPRLPPDVVAVVAEILAGDNDLHTLTKLNRVSHEIHEGTLPVLYETVKFDDEKAVERGIRATSPKGWKYTKFLYVTEITLPLIRMHLRQQTYHLSEPSTDLRKLFPRLAILGLSLITADVPVRKLSPTDYPLHLTLYRPLSLPAAMRASIPYRIGGSTAGVSFFGTYYLRQPEGGGKKRRHKPNAFRDIVGLTLMPGAYLLPCKGQVGMEGWHATWAGFDYTLEIEDEASAEGVQDTLRLVLDHLALHTTMPISRADRNENERRLEIKCPPSVFERFIEMFHSRQPCFLELGADLTLPVDRDTMERYVRALGEAYAVQWVHHPEWENQIFAEIHAPADKMPEHWVGAFDALLTGDHTAAYHGELMFGSVPDGEEDDDPAIVPNGAGYTAMVAEALLSEGQHEHGEVVWEQSFPVAHVPLRPDDRQLGMPAEFEAMLAQLAARNGGGAAGGVPVNVMLGGQILGPGLVPLNPEGLADFPPMVPPMPWAPIAAPLPEIFNRILEHRRALAREAGGDAEGGEDAEEGGEDAEEGGEDAEEGAEEREGQAE